MNVWVPLGCRQMQLAVLAFITVTSAVELKTSEHESNSRACTGPQDEEEMQIIDKIMQGYQKQRVPNRSGVAVSVELHVNDVSALSETNSEFEIDFFFSEIWDDPALQFSTLQTCIESPKNLTLDLSYMEKLWMPNICIVNSKSADIHSSPSQNVFLIIYDDGRVWKNCRMKVKAPCNIDLRRFPFDKQFCTLIFESYSYNSQRVRLDWLQPKPLTLTKSIELPDFLLTKHELGRLQIQYPNGLWDELKVTFYFERRYGFFILQAYIPTYMTIFVAWINFWMDPQELSTRATLAISAFLAMTLQFGNVLSNQPRVSYIKAIDIWMLGGISFLFGALAELAIISYLTRTDRPPSRMKVAHSRQKLVQISIERKCSVPSQHNTLPNTNWTPYKIDKFCLIAYPPSFLLFNVFYWFYYIPLQ